MFKILSLLFILLLMPCASCTVYVSGNGNGDYNCNSTDATLQINQALQSGNQEVYLKGPFTYIISQPINISSCTLLTGDSTATIKLINNAKWNSTVPMLFCNSGHDITIQGFKIDGNREGNTNVISGQNYYNIMYFNKCSNINVNNMYLTNNHGDGLKVDNGNNIKYFNNNIYLLGHDGLYTTNCNNVEAYNNNITIRTNSGLRAYNSNSVKFHDNIISSQGYGSVGIEIQKYNTAYPMNNVEIYNNNIHDTPYSGIWVFGSGAYPTADSYTHIYNNQIYNTGSINNPLLGGVLIDGFNGLIECNTIDSTYGTGIEVGNNYSDLPKSAGFIINVNSNVVTNSKHGYGINNSLSTTHTLVTVNNKLSGNYLDSNITTPIFIPTLPVANFTSSNTTGYNKLTVQFKDNSTNATSYKWDFGDKSTSTVKNPSHTYTKAGNYTVTLTVKNENGTDNITKTNYVSVVSLKTPTAGLTAKVTGRSVQFTDKSTGTITSRVWSFGDKTTSTELTPIHKYTKAGKYTVTLTVSNAAGKSTKSATVIIK